MADGFLIPMLASVDKWLAANTLWHDAVVLILTVALAPLIARALSTFKRFASIPPQRLSVWLLKARLSKADSQLQRMHRLRQDQSYLIVQCFETLFFAIIWLLMTIVVTFAGLAPQSDTSLLAGPNGPLLLASAFPVLYIAFMTSLLEALGIIKTIVKGDTQEKTLEAKIERLKAKCFSKMGNTPTILVQLTMLEPKSTNLQAHRIEQNDVLTWLGQTRGLTSSEQGSMGTSASHIARA